MTTEGILRSELNATTATRFDYLHAAPSSEELHIIWITWSAIAGLVGLLSLLFFLGILSSRKARNRSFNVYVLFITAPDIFFSVACAVTCGLNAAVGQYYSERMCSFQTVYTTFAFTANPWLNAVIVRQVHIMLRSSHRRQRYKPPSIKTVCIHAAIVYLYSAIISSFSLFGTSVHYHAVGRGMACIPMERDLKSSLFFWLCFFWLMLGIPLTYVTYVFIDVKRNKLLPPGGRTRSIAIFFARITFVFVLMWLPTMIAIYMAGRASGPWFGFIGGIWSHFQPLVSASVACMKGDIAEAVKNFVCCKRWWDQKDPDSEGPAEDTPRHNTLGSSLRRSALGGKHRSSLFNSFLLWNKSIQRRSTENNDADLSLPENDLSSGNRTSATSNATGSTDTLRISSVGTNPSSIDRIDESKEGCQSDEKVSVEKDSFDNV